MPLKIFICLSKIRFILLPFRRFSLQTLPLALLFFKKLFALDSYHHLALCHERLLIKVVIKISERTNERLKL